MAAMTEGTVPFRGYRTWYQLVGRLPAAGGGLPLLVVHGGPGLPHDYLEDLAGVADAGRAVVFYDQLGCGKSDDPALWVMDTFAGELATVREALGLDRVHLFGHSWGGWLALEYALRRPSGLASLLLASTCASVPAFAAQTRRLKESLPPEVRRRAVAEMIRVLRPGGLLLLADHIAAATWPVRGLQRLLELATVPLQGEHMLRRPLRQVQAEGLQIQRRERFKAGMVERLAARKPATG